MLPDYGYKIIGVLDSKLEPGCDFCGVPVIGDESKLQELIDNQSVDKVVIALQDYTRSQIARIIERYGSANVEFQIAPDFLEVATTKVVAGELDGIPLATVRRLPLSAANGVVKRIFDLIVATALLVIFSIPMLIIAILIKLTSPGPVLIKQERVGAGNRIFVLYKFRSMYEWAEQNTGPVFATADDPRRTPIGKLLRRFSLDELPQLFNVIKGDMSMVGPRPERPYFVEQFGAKIPGYVDRHLVKPGITGWAQVNDLRGNTSIEERTMYDLYYLENWSLALDIKILIATAFRIFAHRNAY